MKWGLWSTTAASNSATPPDGWPEGQLPSTVNDCAREMMAAIRTGVSDVQFIDMGVTPTQTGNTTFTLAGNQMQWYAYGTRVKANVGGTNLYGTVISSTFTTNTGVTLRLDGPNGPFLTGSLSAVSTGFPGPVSGALPEPTYRFKNPLINGSMDIWQRGFGPYSLSSGTQFIVAADCWKTSLGINSAGAAIAIQRGASVPTVAQAGVVLTSCIQISVNAAVSTLSATDFVIIEQDIEGYDFRQIAQKPLTISFWVNSTLTGTYAIALRNSPRDQSIIANFSISAAATWEKKTISFIKTPSSGTWDYSTGAGLRVSLALAAGSSFQGGAGNWTAGNLLATSSNVNFVGATGRTFMTTGWQIDEGNQALPLEPIMVQQEYARCRRRLNVMSGNTPRFFGYALNAGQAAFDGWPFDVPMRASNPSTSIVAAVTLWTLTNGGTGVQVSVSAITQLNCTPTGFALLVATVGGAGLTAGQGSMMFTSGGPAIALLNKAEF